MCCLLESLHPAMALPDAEGDWITHCLLHEQSVELRSGHVDG